LNKCPQFRNEGFQHWRNHQKISGSTQAYSIHRERWWSGAHGGDFRDFWWKSHRARLPLHYRDR